MKNFPGIGTKHHEPLLISMFATILVIIGFQAYWLKDNYDRENRTMQIKTNVTFQATVQELQEAKLKLPGFEGDTKLQGKSRILVDEEINEPGMKTGTQPRRQVITMVNALRNKLTDTLKTGDSIHSNIIFRFDRGVHHDSLPLTFQKFTDSNNHIYKILYGVDSLQDSIKLPELKQLYSTALKKQHLDVPFTITKSAGDSRRSEQDLSDVTVGFAHPVTYHLSVLNTSSYLWKKLMLPVLFSIFLVGVTVFSFVLLYRNLLRQQRLAEIKNEFISNMTHELKTPIATVSVAIEALKNFNAIRDPGKTKEYLDISGNELQRLSLLVDKVLKLSMFENKQIELNKEPIDVKELTQEVLDTLKPQFEKNGAVVHFNFKGDNYTIHADKLHITSVMYNLLDNTLKYTNNRPVITITLFAQQNSFTLKISDNGIGISPAYRNKIFDKFFRVPTGNQHIIKGYGLGLSYVSEIINRHGGSIGVESELGRGSTFTIQLPVGAA
ncbi:MAG: HAMP domain-containing sensor histidine kinase [Ginsengibacter sp.]